MTLSKIVSDASLLNSNGYLDFIIIITSVYKHQLHFLNAIFQCTNLIQNSYMVVVTLFNTNLTNIVTHNSRQPSVTSNSILTYVNKELITLLNHIARTDLTQTQSTLLQSIQQLDKIYKLNPITTITRHTSAHTKTLHMHTFKKKEMNIHSTAVTTYLSTRKIS